MEENDRIWGKKVVVDAGDSENLAAGQIVTARKLRDENSRVRLLVNPAKSLQSCPTLCDPIDSSLPGSSIHGIFQARGLEWVAISFTWASSQPKDQTQVSLIAGRLFLYHLNHKGSYLSMCLHYVIRSRKV